MIALAFHQFIITVLYATNFSVESQQYTNCQQPLFRLLRREVRDPLDRNASFAVMDGNHLDDLKSIRICDFDNPLSMEDLYACFVLLCWCCIPRGNGTWCVSNLWWLYFENSEVLEGMLFLVTRYNVLRTENREGHFFFLSNFLF